jgi:ATP:ADP antiporter, AAA family
LSGTMALIAFPTLLAAGIFLKGSEGILHSSIDKSAIEMLYIPVPQALKVQVKAVFDMLIQRLSDGVGAVLLLIMTHALGFGLIGVGGVNVILLILWLWVARETRREYVTAIRKRPPEPESAPLPEPSVNNPSAA